MKANMKSLALILALILVLVVATGCSKVEDAQTALDDTPDGIEAVIPEQDTAPVEDEVPVEADVEDEVPVEGENTEVLPSDEDASELLYIPETEGAGYNIPAPVASGVLTKANTKATLDYSNSGDGYVMIKYAGTNSKVKVMVTGPSGTAYTYNIRLDGAYDVFPLSDGNGGYKVGVYENISGTSYSTAFSHSITVTLNDQLGPFMRSNKYVDYSAASAVVKKAADLTKNCITSQEKVDAVYKFVIGNITYDYTLADKVASGEVSGYIPVLDSVLSSGKGICFDYAAVMTAMLRSQGVPTQLVFGYAGETYHAWINVYSAETNTWETATIYYDGTQWKRMDPTFASTASSSSAILSYIGNGANYVTKFIY